MTKTETSHRAKPMTTDTTHDRCFTCGSEITKADDLTWSHDS